jgi:hypothetical protein
VALLRGFILWSLRFSHTVPSKSTVMHLACRAEPLSVSFCQALSLNVPRQHTIGSCLLCSSVQVGARLCFFGYLALQTFPRKAFACIMIACMRDGVKCEGGGFECAWGFGCVCVFLCLFRSACSFRLRPPPPRSCPTQSTEQRQTCCLALDLHFLCEESSQGREESVHVNLHVASQYFQHIIPTMAAAPESPIREAAPQSHHLFHALSAPLDEHYVLDGAHFAKPHAHAHSQAHTHAMLPPPLLPSSYVHGMPMYAPPPPHNPSPAAAPAPAQHYGHHTSHAAVSNPLSSGAYHSPPPSPAHPSATPSSSKRRRRRASSESDEDSDGAWSDGQQGDEELMPKWSVSMLLVRLFWFVRCPRSRLFPL